MGSFINTYIQLFFLLTPFCVTSSFLSMTAGHDSKFRRGVALRTMLAIIVITFILFFFGKYIFEFLGITLDAFRIGAGALLFLSAISLVKGVTFYKKPGPDEDFAVVPLAIPIAVGPGTIGTLMVFSIGTENMSQLAITGIALLLATLSVSALLFVSTGLEKLLGPRGLAVLSKLSGLVLASLAAQIIFEGVNNLLVING